MGRRQLDYLAASLGLAGMCRQWAGRSAAPGPAGAGKKLRREVGRCHSRLGKLISWRGW